MKLFLHLEFLLYVTVIISTMNNMGLNNHIVRIFWHQKSADFNLVHCKIDGRSEDNIINNYIYFIHENSRKKSMKIAKKISKIDRNRIFRLV